MKIKTARVGKGWTTKFSLTEQLFGLFLFYFIPREKKRAKKVLSFLMLPNGAFSSAACGARRRTKRSMFECTLGCHFPTPKRMLAWQRAKKEFYRVKLRFRNLVRCVFLVIKKQDQCLCQERATYFFKWLVTS